MWPAREQSGGLVVPNLKRKYLVQPNSRSEFELSLSHFHRHHITHVETVFSWSVCLRWQERSRESGHNHWWWYEWSRGRVHRCSKSVPPNRDNFWEGSNIFRWHRQRKCQAYFQDIGSDKVYQSNGRHLSCLHSDILCRAELPSLLKAEQRIEKAEKP